MVNEALAKLLCHNLWCLVSVWYELGVEPVFNGIQNGELGSELWVILPFSSSQGR